MARRAPFDLSTKDVDDLLALRSQIDRQLAQRRATLERELSRMRAVTSGSTKAGGRASTKGTTVPPKYRGPKGETWAGRGVRPRWLVALMRQGHKMEEYAIGQQAAPRKKMPARKSRKTKPRRKRR